MTLNLVELQDFIDRAQPDGPWEAGGFGFVKHSKKMMVENLEDQDGRQKHHIIVS